MTFNRCESTKHESQFDVLKIKMVAFSREVWLDRARKRSERAEARIQKPRIKKKLKAIREKLARDEDAISGLTKLIDWCLERSIVVNFAQIENGTFNPPKTIEISGRAAPETQLFWLLHECGHSLIENSEKRIIKRGRRGSALEYQDQRSLTTRIEYVKEELEAWDRGFSLAERLGIFINKVRWNKQRSQALATYFKWSVRAE